MSSPFHPKNSVLTGAASISNPIDIYNIYEPQSRTHNHQFPRKSAVSSVTRPPLKAPRMQGPPTRGPPRAADAAWTPPGGTRSGLEAPAHRQQPPVVAQGSGTRRNTARKAMSPRRSLGQSEPAPPLDQSRAAIPERRRGLERAPHVLRLRAGRTFWPGRRGRLRLLSAVVVRPGGPWFASGWPGRRRRPLPVRGRGGWSHGH